MRQENADDFIQMAKDFAKAERELGVQKWVSISIERVDKNRNKEQIFNYDLPREVYERWEWVVNWRRAKLVCKYPKDHVNCYFSFYDKRLGNNPKFISDLKTLASAKAQTSRAQASTSPRSTISCGVWTYRHGMEIPPVSTPIFVV